MTFNEEGYVKLTSVLSEKDCNNLLSSFLSVVGTDKTHKDDQCPSSEAIYGLPVFDELLEKLLPEFERVTNKKLIPTYSYARMYKKGEELRPHTDRPSCEISATITLGTSCSGWSIWFADPTNSSETGSFVGASPDLFFVDNIKELKMQVGDAVIYRGIDKVHWRNTFDEGWQAQVFLHYVDAEGEYSSLKYDGRTKLSHHSDDDVLYWFFDSAVNETIIKELIDQCEADNNLIDAEINIGDNATINKAIRDVKKVELLPHSTIGSIMVGLGVLANSQAWQFDITHANQTDYLKYDVNGHYQPHIDTFITSKQSETRKLTVLAFLNEDFEGGKFYIQSGSEKVYPPQKAGTVLVFPSFLLHGVEPVTKGIRRSVVSWLVGKWFK